MDPRPALAIAHEIEKTIMSDAEILKHCGDDADKWAHEFCKRYPTGLCQIVGSEGAVQEGEWLDIVRGWFANAIEHSHVIRSKDDVSMSEQTGTEMPRYKCHKEVWALKIFSIEFPTEDGAALIAPTDRGYAPFETKPGYERVWRGTEDDLGFYVQYADGYESWSPSKAFEDGYTRIN